MKSNSNVTFSGNDILDEGYFDDLLAKIKKCFVQPISIKDSEQGCVLTINQLDQVTVDFSDILRGHEPFPDDTTTICVIPRYVIDARTKENPEADQEQIIEDVIISGLTPWRDLCKSYTDTGKKFN